MKVTTKEIPVPATTTTTSKLYECEVVGCGFVTEYDVAARHHHGVKHAAKETRKLLRGEPDCFLFESKADAEAHLEAYCDRPTVAFPVREVAWEGPGWYYAHQYEGWFRGESETRLKYRPLQNEINFYRDQIHDHVDSIRRLREPLKK